MKKTALIIGATGATGKSLLKHLIADDDFEKILLFVRRPLTIDNEKVEVNVVEFDKPTEWQPLVKGDVAFSCLGTTLKDAGSKAAQWEVDYTYQYEFASMADSNSVPTYLLVSSIGANDESFIFYNRLKGELERDVQTLTFKNTLIFRPGPLIRANTTRKAEKIAIRLLLIFNKLGLFRRQKPLSTDLLAKAMVDASKTPTQRVEVLENKIIHQRVA